MIKPTIGRVVWYRPGARVAPDNWTYHGNGEPLAALVTHVWSDRMVNLAAFDSNGQSYGFTSVVLLQDGDAVPEHGDYCEWMPFQKGQAAKTEAAEKTALELGAEARRAGLAGS